MAKWSLWARQLAVAGAAMALTAGCSSSFPVAGEPDPFEPFNRAVFAFNMQADRIVLRPVAYLYRGLVPGIARQGVSNFFNNIDELTTILYGILQAKFTQAGSDVLRFLINSTVGLLGLIDVASEMGLEQHYEDFGLVLASWGFTESWYLMLPILGSSTVRDATGVPLSLLGLNLWVWVEPEYIAWTAVALDLVNRRAQLLEGQQFFETAAVDQYIFVRNAYFQMRNRLIRGNDADEFDDEWDDWDTEDSAEQIAENEALPTVQQVENLESTKADGLGDSQDNTEQALENEGEEYIPSAGFAEERQDSSTTNNPEAQSLKEQYGSDVLKHIDNEALWQLDDYDLHSGGEYELSNDSDGEDVVIPANDDLPSTDNALTQP